MSGILPFNDPIQSQKFSDTTKNKTMNTYLYNKVILFTTSYQGTNLLNFQSDLIRYVKDSDFEKAPQKFQYRLEQLAVGRGIFPDVKHLFQKSLRSPI